MGPLWRGASPRQRPMSPPSKNCTWSVRFYHFINRDKKKVHEELDKALSVLIENDVDMIIIEYFFYIQVRP